MALHTDRKITLAIGSASLVALAIAAIAVAGTKRFVSDAGWVAHSHEVRGALAAVPEHLNAAKADVRGFLLTNDSAYVRHFSAQIDSMKAEFGRVQLLTADNAAQQHRLADIARLLATREDALRSTLGLGSRVRRLDDTVASHLAQGEQLSKQIDSVVNAADVVERELLASRTGREGESERFVLLASAALVLTAVGSALFLGRSIRRDLTGRARAERELRASEAKFAGILSIAADAIITVDAQQKIVHFNHGAEEMFGYHRAEALGQPLEMLLPARHARTHRDHVKAFSTGSETARRMGERTQVFGRRKNGDEFPAEASISKLETPAGWLFTAVVRDVSARMRLEHDEHALAMAGVQLAQSLDYEQTLTRVAELPVPSVGVWTVLHVVEESDTEERTLRRLVSAHPDPDVAAALRELQRAPLDWDAPHAVIDVLRTGEARRIETVTTDWIEAHANDEHEVELTRRLGVHSLLLVPLIARERVVGAWSIGSSAEHHFDEHDAALAAALAERAALAIENARLFRSVQRATAARDQVLSVVSHDLRNPLAAMSMFARRLLDDQTSAVERRTIGSNLLNSVDWMHRLMTDLLDASSIEAGRLSIEAEPSLVSEIVESAFRMFADRAAEQSIELRTELLAGLPRVHADGSRIVQVLGNLVGNALKFTEEHGTITVGATPQRGAVCIWVRDTGAGIPESEIAHVFDRYWHARRNSTSRGTGLGLAIAQGIVQRHGGRIWVESTVGEGSTFSFTLPVVRDEALRPREAAAAH